MSKKRVASTSKTLDHFFGSPPLLEGEDAAAYEKVLAGVSNSVRPTDFVEEIWVRDAVDVIWNIFRLRRIEAAFLSAKVWDDVNDEASSLAEAEAELLEGTEKEAMDRLLDNNSGLSWEKRVAQYPRANEKFQELWTSAKATLNIDKIQANVIVPNLDMIERIKHLIIVDQQRFDAIIRELDRHRVTQNLRNRNQRVDDVKFRIVKPEASIRKITNKKVA
jgi:hypothetical protein